MSSVFMLSGKYRKATPSVQYKPAILPPAIMFVNLAKSSAVGNFVHSMMTISLKGSYLIVTPFSICFGPPCYGFHLRLYDLIKFLQKRWLRKKLRSSVCLIR